jgi:NADH:ubiquinone oxidoreductase subunit 4 (subunit M)
VAYGILRFMLPVFSASVVSCMLYFVFVLGTISIVYATLTALTSGGFKKNYCIFVSCTHGLRCFGLVFVVIFKELMVLFLLC